MASGLKGTRRQGERGYAMVVALLVVALLVAGGALMGQELMVRSKLLSAETNELHLQNVLDSAVSHMMAKYRYEPGFAGEERLKIDGGEAKMRARQLSPALREVEIAAHYQGMQRRAVINLLVESDQPIRLTDYRFQVGGAAFAGP